MTFRKSLTIRLLAGASIALIGLAASSAMAADATLAADTQPLTGAGAEGTEVEGVVITAERNQAATMAPAKASLEQVQPEAIISHAYIEQVTPEVGGWADIVTIAPSMSGITSNGGGVGEYNKVTLRGFQDGFFNITYDGIAFGDTNNPTHHTASYLPASTIGAAVVDRGPGEAGDLGQANFGGAIHYFSPEVQDNFGVTQKVTYGSYDTYAGVTTFNTGDIAKLGGGKMLLNFDERTSNGELSHSGGDAFNQLFKYIQPLGDKGSLTLFTSHEWTKFYEGDAGPGETWAQVLAYGNNFALNNNPTDEHYYKFNWEKKQSDFDYIDLKYQVTPKLAVENQPYTYFYSNKTNAANDITGMVGGANTSPPQAKGSNPNDIGGYDKRNEYRVWGDVTRFRQDLPYGTLKVGGLVETSNTYRHNYYIDFTKGGAPDNKYTSPFPSNEKLEERSSWFQWQAFVDLNLKLDNLTISPGFKYVDFTRKVNAAWENVAGGTKHQPLVGRNEYSSPLYFLTVNYKVTPDFALYAQYATSFLIPQLSDLYVTGAALQALQPDSTVTYQGGFVYTHSRVTADADVYEIDAKNLEGACNIPDPTAGNPNNTEAGFCDFGKARYSGVEGEIAYAFPEGLTVFANGSLNTPKQEANPANATLGIPANLAETLTNSPKWTDAAGVIYHHGPWQGSLTYKQSGAYVAGYNGSQAVELPGYDTFDASATYNFRHFAVKVQAYNLGNKRAITSFGGAKLYSTSDPGLYQFQSGREVYLTLVARY